MNKIWMTGTALVGAIAGLKTWLVAQFAIPTGSIDLATVSALFALFFALTAVVAYVTYNQLEKYIERQRKNKLAPGVGSPAAKETVILRSAPEWGLSQAEADVAIFVAKGFSNSEIAEMRGCAIATVKSQLSKIYQKSGLDSRYQLIAFVTDEVCEMANETEEKTHVQTRNVLPLAGRNRSAA